MTAWTRALATAVACALACLIAPPAAAQVYIGRDVPRTGSFEVSGGVVWSPGFDLGTQTAELTRNPGTGTSGFELFTSETRTAGAAGVQARVSFYLTRAFAIEGGLQYAQPVLSSSLTSDAEQADDAVVKETIARYVFEGSAVLHFTNASFAGGKGVPFVTAGGGYIRELHEGDGVVETGNEFHAGAGVKYWFTQGRRRLGLRADVGASLRSGGIDFSDSRRTIPTVGLSIAYLF